jgi:hypothetical protein
VRQTVVRDDRPLAPTLWTARCIIPVLVAAWVILYLFPDRTEQLWAWTITPRMTPLLMGGGYLAGAYFFSRVSFTRRWHQVGWGFAATTVFTALLLVATILHWDRFNHTHVSFWAWVALYVVTPLLLPILFLNNRRRDPGGPDARDVRVPTAVRAVVAAAGAAVLVLAVVMFVFPDGGVARWPWKLSPLTDRTIAAFLSFPAVMWLCFLVDDRWSSFEILMQTVTLGLVLVGIGALRARADFHGRPTGSVWVFAVALSGAMVLLVVLQAAMRVSASRPRRVA